MEILAQVNEDWLRHQISEPDSLQHVCAKQRHYVEIVLHRSFCYLVSLDIQEVMKLVINSSPLNPHPQFAHEYPTIGQAVEEILRDEEFLSRTTTGGGLNGRHVVKNLNHLNTVKNSIFRGFILDAITLPNLNGRDDELYVIDGMHRLVAYSLWTRRSNNHAPTLVYYGTDTEK